MANKKKKMDRYAPKIQKTMDRYAPKIQEEPIDKRPAKLLMQFGLLFVLMGALLVLPGVWMGILMVQRWIYTLTIGLALALLLGAGTVYCFQRNRRHKVMRYVVITLVILLVAVIYFFGSLTYMYATDDSGQGIFESPNGDHGLYVCRVDKMDEEGEVTETVYRGYRCYGRQAYIYEENEVPAGDGFEVVWEDADTATLTSGENSVTIEFGVVE